LKTHLPQVEYSPTQRDQQMRESEASRSSGIQELTAVADLELTELAGTWMLPTAGLWVASRGEQLCGKVCKYFWAIFVLTSISASADTITLTNLNVNFRATPPFIWLKGGTSQASLCSLRCREGRDSRSIGMTVFIT
jgi:hypothetical protein